MFIIRETAEVSRETDRSMKSRRLLVNSSGIFISLLFFIAQLVPLNKNSRHLEHNFWRKSGAKISDLSNFLSVNNNFNGEGIRLILRFHEKKQKFNCYGNQLTIKLLTQVLAREKSHKYKVKVIKSSFFSEFRNPLRLQTN